jgi:preprotein translocase subunit SecD
MLGALVGLIAVLFGVIGSGVVWSNAQWTPKLGLDLEGGWEIVMQAVPQPGTTGTVTQETLDEAVKIIRQRINGAGVSEAEITTQGTKNIVVSIPGKNPDQATINSVKQAAALEFRPVLVEQAATPPQASTSPTSSGSPGATASPSGSASSLATATLKGGTAPASATGSAPGSAPASASASATATASGNGMAVPAALLAASPTPTTTGSATAAAATPTGAAAATGAATPKPSGTGASPAASGSPTAQPKPTNASDMNWINEGVATQFQTLDCSQAANRRGSSAGDPKKPLVTCSQAGDAKYILGPTELSGTDVSGASANLETNSQGAVGTAWEVDMSFTSAGTAKFAAVTQRLAGLTGSQNQFAIVLDGLVVSAPRTNEVINTGSARITGNFTQETAQALANQLKFGALPISFQVQTSENITATLGSEQLRRGLLAGVIGLVLVVLYSLLQYRALGLVTVSSLVIASVVTYGLVVLLGWRQGYRLSLPGVAGLIVSIGITADSFIVYFERVRDEVRDGRGLIPAVESAWGRARRTILISDAVSFLAAAVLYVLAIGGVKGFAFTLGLTTIVDILVVFLFTHPMVGLLARTRFFGGGHRLSGFDAEHLGRAVAYTGRATVRNQPRRKGPSGRRPQPVTAGGLEDGEDVVRSGATIAERRAAAEKARRDALSAEPGEGGADIAGGAAGSGAAGSGDADQTLDPERLTLEHESAGDSRRRDV